MDYVERTSTLTHVYVTCDLTALDKSKNYGVHINKYI